MGNKRLLKLFMVALFAMLLAACGGEDVSKEKGNVNEEGTDDIQSDEGESNKEDTPEEENEANENTAGAVKPKSASETVSFTKVTWLGGSPKRELNAGVWYYTEDDHPEKYEDTFDWEDEDVLLWQIGDEKYKGYSAETEQLKVIDDDVIKIIVSLEEGTSDQMPRNFLKVGKGSLEGKGFLIETVEGEELSLE